MPTHDGGTVMNGAPDVGVVEVSCSLALALGGGVVAGVEEFGQAVSFLSHDGRE